MRVRSSSTKILLKPVRSSYSSSVSTGNSDNLDQRCDLRVALNLKGHDIDRRSKGKSFHSIWLRYKKELANELVHVALDAFVDGIIAETSDRLSNLQNLNLDLPEKKLKYEGNDNGTSPFIIL